MPQSKRLEKKLFKRCICRSLAMYSGIHQNPRDIRLYTYNGKFSRTYGLDTLHHPIRRYLWTQMAFGVASTGALGLGTWRNAVSLKNRKPYPSDSGVRCML